MPMNSSMSVKEKPWRRKQLKQLLSLRDENSCNDVDSTGRVLTFTAKVSDLIPIRIRGHSYKEMGVAQSRRNVEGVVIKLLDNQEL